jgi:hypothetical protein
MSSDGKDSGAIWQGPTNKPQQSQQSQQSQQQNQARKQEKPRARKQSTPDEPYTAHQSVPEGGYDDAALYDDDDNLSIDMSPHMTRGFFRRWSPVLIPLILAGLTSIIVLPPIVDNYVRVPYESFWLVITLIIVVATIASIVALYYSNENKGWRFASITGSIFLFALIASFALAGPATGFVILIALIVLAALLARRYFLPVPEDFVDIVYAFGKYDRTLYAGPNILLPWEKVKYELKISEKQWLCPLQRVQLSPNEDVLLRALVSYQLYAKDAYLAVTRADNWEKQFQDTFITEVQTIGTMFVPDDFISWPEGLHTPSSTEANTNSLARREQVNNYLYRRISARAERWGILVHWVGIRDVMIAPHGAEIDTEALLTPPALSDTPEQTQVTTQSTATLKPASTMVASAAQKSDEAVHPQKVPTPPKLSESAPSIEQLPPASPPKVLKEEILIKAYKEVQDGKVTDPLAIREIAANFRAVASDPQASEMVSFDAERAAQNLYEQANKYEELYSGKQRV